MAHTAANGGKPISSAHSGRQYRMGLLRP
jgi:hypothetical protein